jgi:hypothetical protein
VGQNQKSAHWTACPIYPPKADTAVRFLKSALRQQRTF